MKFQHLQQLKAPFFKVRCANARQGGFSAQNLPGTGFFRRFAAHRRSGSENVFARQSKKIPKRQVAPTQKSGFRFLRGSRFCFIVPYFTAGGFDIPLRKSFYQPQQQQTITIAIRMMIQQLLLPKNESKQPIAQPPFTNGRICLRRRKC